MGNPCINCREEAGGCRYRCPIGLAIIKKNEEKKRKIKEGKLEQRDADAYKCETIQKITGKKGKQR